MEEYPRTLDDLEANFSTEEACRAYLYRLRWPDGFQCPKCGHGKAWPVGRRLFQCKACGRQTSVTAGTIFQDSRTPLTKWFRAIWWVTSQKTGARCPTKSWSAENRRERSGIAGGTGPGDLQNRLDMAA